MLNAPVIPLTVREEFEECGHSFALFVALLTTDLDLPQRAKLALLEYGMTQLNRFEQAEEMLCNYVEDTAPS